MAAPSAPVISAIQTGKGFVRVRWDDVPTALHYNLYVGDTTAPVGLEDTISEADIGIDGRFTYFVPLEQIGQTYLRLTALNALGEESAYSNERHLNMTIDVDSQAPGRAKGRIPRGIGQFS